MKKPDCAKCRYDHIDEFSKSLFGKCESCMPMKKYELQLERNRKFKAGKVIDRPGELLKQQWVMYNGRVKHIEVIKNFQLGIVLRLLKRGAFQYAILKSSDISHEV